MVGHMQLKIRLIFQILNKIFKLSFAKFFMHWNFLHFLLQKLLMVLSYIFSKGIDQFKSTNFEKNI